VLRELTSRRYAAADVHYPADGGARAALVIAADPMFAPIVAEHTAWLAEAAPYRPGAFFARELPALRAVLAVAGPIDLLVIDGYVYLDPEGRPGLGAHAHAEFAVPVIGVAKTAFRSASQAIEVRRGGASRPLYVTSAGIPTEEAADLVRKLAGSYRLPDALRRVDQLARTGTCGGGPGGAISGG
jgi:deoxyribonuclease V